MTLNLDYQNNARPFPWVGAALLAVALAALLAASAYYRTMLEQIAYWEGQAGKFDRASGRQASSGQRDLADMALEIKHANEVLGQITLPWDSLFHAVEGSAGKDVALLTIEPDAEKRQVKISGEGKNMAAVLNYIGHLAAQESFSGVYLQRHEVQRREPENPVRFTVVVAWKMGP